MGAKQNLKQYLDAKCISPAQFYRDSGLSNGFLNQGENISSNNIEIIISIYSDLNLVWLITGSGEMLNNNADCDNNGKVKGQVNGKVTDKNKKSDEETYKTNADKERKNNNPIDEKMYITSLPKENQPLHDIAAESSMHETYGKKESKEQYSGANEIIMNLVDQIREQSEEIGALRHEITTLKYRLTQIAEDVGNAQDVPA